jgi:hypothetical protein
MPSPPRSGNARALQHDAHKDKQWDCQQNFVRHDAEDALRQRAQDRKAHDTEHLPGDGENQ